MNIPQERILINKVELLVIILLSLVILAGFPGCSSRDNLVFIEQKWTYDQLRAMDPVDADLPQLDILAVYVSDDLTNISIRIDLLDIELIDTPHVLITIDFKPGGSNSFPLENNYLTYQNSSLWDLAIDLQSDGEVKGFDYRQEKILGIKTSIYKDVEIDTLTVNISKGDLIPKRAPFSFDVFTIEPAGGIIVDSVKSITSSGIPPSPARVLLGFWNTSLGVTPADVLRKWDGAHSGPLSSRHGLKYLVEASELYNLPIVLFDVGVKPSWVALEFLGVGGIFGGWCVGCEFDCVGDNDYTQFRTIPANYGIPIETRMKVVAAAFTGERVCIGGDFTQSLFGVPSVSMQAFRYIAEHPWMIPVAQTDLQSTKSFQWNNCYGNPSEIITDVEIDPMLDDNFLKQYQSAPDNLLKELAWQTYQTLLCPLNQLDGEIIGNYFGQLGHILSASEWVEEPFPISTCNRDLDWDGDFECVLASERIYITVEPKGGYLAFAFYKENDIVHQILGPMYEVALGLGDPATINPEEGVFADGRLVPGALAKRNQRTEYFSLTYDRDQIELVSENMQIRKSIMIKDRSVQIMWKSDDPINFEIPLILDPWLMNTTNWSSQYYKQSYNGRWIWGLKNMLEITIKTPSDHEFDTFLDSKKLLNQPEDPNFEYPKGHYLPFPTAVLNLSPSKTGAVELIFMKP